MDAAQHTQARTAPARKWWWLIVGIVIVLDQLTKLVVRSTINEGDSVPSADAFIRLVHTYNTGISFSLFDGSPEAVRIITLLLTLGMVALFAFMQFTGWTDLVGGAMFVGGAIGNVIDRQYLEGVTDFFKVGSFPAFNVADSCIVLGVAIFILANLVHARQASRQEETA